MVERAGHQVVGEASDRREALNLTQALRPDIAVLDIPSLNGLDAAREIRRVAPHTKVILLTEQADKTDVLRGLGTGAKGYILKSQAAEDLIPAIREATRGETYLSSGVATSLVSAYLQEIDPSADPLTARERQVLQLIAEGKTTREIAGLLGISFKTAEAHRRHIMQKLDIHETAGVVRYAIRHGLLQP